VDRELGLRDLLIGGIQALDIEFSGDQVDKLLRHVGEISMWNKRINLVGAAGSDLIKRHVLDCLSGLRAINKLDPGTILDAGSGAGFPGIPLAIFLPNVPVVLVERSAKRAAFLQNVKALIGLDNCTVINEPLEKHTRLYDLVCCRAFISFDRALELLAPRAAKNGVLLFYKGRRSVVDDELCGLSPNYARHIVKLTVPFLNEERHLLQLRQTNR